jgi:NAD(P)-dependent dehydrogenase (short-subunit alcohol dehydrogenase family)
MNTSKVVVITGASAGVGRATTRAFARHGAHIGLLARGKDRLEAVRAEVESLGGKGLVIPTDVAHPGEVEAAAESVEAKFGPIDIWVNNAMVTIFSPFSRISPEEYRRVTEVTYLGSVYGTMTALKRMMPRDSGTIVQVGSALAYRGIPLQSAYCGAKHALRGFIDSVRTELIHDKSKVHLTMVQLPALNTPQFSWSESHMPYHPQPVPPIYQPEVAADAIVWAAHHRHREVYVAGSTVAAVLGNKLIPGLVDHYLGRTGYSSQLTDRPVKPDRPSNLFAPASGDYGAHGIFGSKSHSKSWHFLVAKALGWTFLPDLIGGMASAATMGFSALRRAAK